MTLQNAPREASHVGLPMRGICTLRARGRHFYRHIAMVLCSGQNCCSPLLLALQGQE